MQNISHRPLKRYMYKKTKYDGVKLIIQIEAMSPVVYDYSTL